MRFRIVVAGMFCALMWGTPRLTAQEAPAATPGAAPAARPAGGAQAQARRQQTLTGRVAAKTENGFSLQPLRRNSAATPVTVTAETTFARFEQARLQDLTEGCLVAVTGERDGAKLTANGILNVAKPLGTPTRAELRTANTLARAALQSFARTRRTQPAAGANGQPAETPPAPPQAPETPAAAAAPGAARANQPVVGRVISLQPLTIETAPLGQNAQPEKLEVQPTERARVLRHTPIKFADIEEGAFVQVLPQIRRTAGQAPAAAEPGAPVVARAVIVTRLPGQGGRRGQQQQPQQQQ